LSHCLSQLCTNQSLRHATGKKILIKGMVCDRCILSIKNELEKTGVQIADIYLGEATILHTEGPS
jgi:copper chaperone CopZ